MEKQQHVYFIFEFYLAFAFFDIITITDKCAYVSANINCANVRNTYKT